MSQLLCFLGQVVNSQAHWPAAGSHPNEAQNRPQTAPMQLPTGPLPHPSYQPHHMDVEPLGVREALDSYSLQHPPSQMVRGQALTSQTPFGWQPTDMSFAQVTRPVVDPTFNAVPPLQHTLLAPPSGAQEKQIGADCYFTARSRGLRGAPTQPQAFHRYDPCCAANASASLENRVQEANPEDDGHASNFELPDMWDWSPSNDGRRLMREAFDPYSLQHRPSQHVAGQTSNSQTPLRMAAQNHVLCPDYLPRRSPFQQEPALATCTFGPGPTSSE